MKDIGFEFKKNFICSTSEGYLHLIILPTEKCNFRCTYCYEDFEIGKMNENTVVGIKNLLSKAAPTLRNLDISWFGGEPTLNKKAVIDISSHIKALQSELNFIYKAHMTTNGYLLDLDMFSQFVDLGITGYQISLDGEKDSHDTTRPQLNGKGSFDVIWSNLESYRQLDSDFSVGLRLHVTAQNTKSMFQLCDSIKNAFGQDNRFHTVIKDIKNLGKGTETADANAYMAANAAQRVAELKVFMSKKNKSKAIENDAQNTKSDKDTPHNPYICYASKPRQLMIRADGSIGKCTVMLNDDRNNLGKLNRNGEYELDGDKMDIWTRGFISLNEQEIGCPAQKMPKLEKSEKVAKFNHEIDIVEVA